MGRTKMPDTSIQAYEEKTFDSIQTDWNKIISALKVIGSGHYEDIAIQMQTTDLNVVSRRMKEMRERGMIYNTGDKKKTKRGRWAYVHCITTDSQPKTQSQTVAKIENHSQVTSKSDQSPQPDSHTPVIGSQIGINF